MSTRYCPQCLGPIRTGTVSGLFKTRVERAEDQNMSLRALVISLAVSGVLASSCASTARDTFLEIYDEETAASSFDESCRINAVTFATATDSYVALNGTTPESAADLVPEWILETPEAWDFDPSSDSSFSPSAGGRCDGFDIDRSSPSIGQSAVDVITDGKNAACVTNKRQIETALEAHFVVNGYDALTIDELLEFGVKNELNRWTLQVPTNGTTVVPMVVPIVGGPCDG
jgi:hypothetical protein